MYYIAYYMVYCLKFRAFLNSIDCSSNVIAEVYENNRDFSSNVAGASPGN